jgi:hypothetical protein
VGTVSTILGALQTVPLIEPSPWHMCFDGRWARTVSIGRFYLL